MPTLAFLLVLLAAFAHSGWNLLAKRAAHVKHLIWFSSVSESLLFAPVAVWALAAAWPNIRSKAAMLLVATGVLHLLYAESLLRGYRAGDLSVVYPVARGSGPLLSFFGAILILGERPSALATAGAMLVTCGVLLLSGGGRTLQDRAGRAGLLWGIATGFTIACYTLVDGYSVKKLLLSPLLVEYAGNVFRTIALAPGAWRRRALLGSEYRANWKAVLGIAVLTPCGYVLVLFAMKLAPVSHIAPMREISMMIGAYLGAKFLGEGYALRRVLGAAIIAAGAAMLAFG